jgi:hypothetical protein
MDGLNKISVDQTAMARLGRDADLGETSLSKAGRRKGTCFTTPF